MLAVATHTNWMWDFLTCSKAQEDAEKLRSVVMPMEQEITGLKARLTTAEERVKELEASKVKSFHLFDY